MRFIQIVPVPDSPGWAEWKADKLAFSGSSDRPIALCKLRNRQVIRVPLALGEAILGTAQQMPGWETGAKASHPLLSWVEVPPTSTEKATEKLREALAVAEEVVSGSYSPGQGREVLVGKAAELFLRLKAEAASND